MERYERYRKYKFSKTFDSKMATLTFNNLHASLDKGPINNVQVVYYRNGKFIHIYKYDNSGYFVGIHLRQATVDANIGNQIILHNEQVHVRIFFNSPEEREFFLNEIQSDESSSSSGESTDSGTLSS